MISSRRCTLSVVAQILALATAPCIAWAGATGPAGGGCGNPSGCAINGGDAVASVQRLYPGQHVMAASIAAQRALVYNAQAQGSTAVAESGNGVPSYVSAFEIGGTGLVLIDGTATDASGNILLAGAFWGTVSFPTAPAPTRFTSSGDADVFVAKFNPGGECLWTRTARGISGAPANFSMDGALTVTVDPQGNAYAGGGFVNRLTFLDAAGQHAAQLTATPGTGYGYEAFLVKYDPDGNLLWAQGGMSGATKSSSPLNGDVNAVVSSSADRLGNLFASGTVNGANFLGHPVITSTSGSGAIARLEESDGHAAWAQVLDDNNSDGAFDDVLALGSDNAGGVYAMGYGNGTQMSFPTLPAATLLSINRPDVENFPTDSSFLARFNNRGQCLWAEQPTGAPQYGGYVSTAALAVGPLGDLYVTGVASWDAQFFASNDLAGPEIEDTFVARYDDAGNLLWVKAFQTLGSPLGSGFSFGTQIAVDGAGNAYVGGQSYGATSITDNDSAPAPFTLGSGTGYFNFVAMFDAAGTPHWIRSLANLGETNFNSGVVDVPGAGFTIDTLALTYNPAAGLVHTGGTFAGTLALDNLKVKAPTSETSAASFLASFPSQNGSAGPNGTNPTIQGKIAGAGSLGGSRFYADVTLINSGGATAYNTCIAGESVRDLAGLTVSANGPALPACLGDIAPSAQRTKRLYFTIKGAGRFALNLQVGMENAAQAALTTAMAFSVPGYGS